MAWAHPLSESSSASTNETFSLEAIFVIAALVDSALARDRIVPATSYRCLCSAAAQCQPIYPGMPVTSTRSVTSRLLGLAIKSHDLQGRSVEKKPAKCKLISLLFGGLPGRCVFAQTDCFRDQPATGNYM